MELRRIAKDVYACLQPERGLGWSNSGFVNRGGGVVIDTFWDLPLTRRLIESYASVWKEPARRVVNTHHNGDHCWGNQLFESAEIIGHRLCAASFGKERPEAMQALRESGGFGDKALSSFAKALRPFNFAGIVLTPPTTLIDKRLELDLDGVAMELLYVGPAHTLGDVIVHLPEQRVIFAGDVLFRLCTPVGWEGTFAKLEEALDRIVALQPEVVVPGHGPLCDATGAREMKAYLSTCAPSRAASSTRACPCSKRRGGSTWDRTRAGASRSAWCSASPAPTASSVARRPTARSTRRRCFATCTRCRSITRRARDERRDR